MWEVVIGVLEGGGGGGYLVIGRCCEVLLSGWKVYFWSLRNLS